MGQKQNRRIVLRAADDVDFSVLKTSSTSLAFSVSKTSSKHGRVCWLELTFQPKELGKNRANIVIETNHPKSRKVSISVRGIGSDSEK